MRIAALSSLLLLGACATAPVLDGPTVLNGRGFDTAVNLYGPYDERAVLDGRETYIWRRAVILGGKTYYCELRTRTGFRQTIANTVLQGYPAACSLFSVQFRNAYDRPEPKPPAETRVADRGPGHRPMELSAR